MTNGLPRGGATRTDNDAVFTPQKPTFQAPQNAEYTTPKVRDNSPAPSLLQAAKNEGNDKLATLIAKAQESAKAAMDRKQGKVVPSSPRKTKQVVAPTTNVDAGVQFGAEDVCDDRTFVIRTRSGDYHTPEMKRLFWANGGKEHMKAGLSYASAFSNLRTEKIKAISSKR